MDKAKYLKQEKSLQIDLAYARKQLYVFQLALRQFIEIRDENNEVYYYIVEKITIYRKAVDDCENLLIDLHKRYLKALEKGEVK